MKIEVMINGTKLVLDYVGRDGQKYVYSAGAAYFTFDTSLKVATGKTVRYKNDNVYVIGEKKSERSGDVKRSGKPSAELSEDGFQDNEDE